jgi:hypothetical protein
MVPPPGAEETPSPIDRPILEFLQTRLRATNHVAHAVIAEVNSYLELHVIFTASYFPATVDEAQLTVRWYTNDDFKLHYREVHLDHVWKCRWDRHPNPHNTRDHFHPPLAATTPGDDASWPDDHRDVVAFVLNEIEDRIVELWDE